jgi:hypothetical protein
MLSNDHRRTLSNCQLENPLVVRTCSARRWSKKLVELQGGLIREQTLIDAEDYLSFPKEGFHG